MFCNNCIQVQECCENHLWKWTDVIDHSIYKIEQKFTFLISLTYQRKAFARRLEHELGVEMASVSPVICNNS